MISDDKQLHNNATRNIWRIFAAWAIFAIGVLLWWVIGYGGLVGIVGEWQFTNADGYFPALTLIFPTLLVTLPLAWLLDRPTRRRGAQLTSNELFAQRLVASHRMTTFFMTVAVAAITISLATIVAMALIRGNAGPITRIDVASASVNPTPEGPVELVGMADLTVVGKLSEQVGMMSRDLYVAPVRVVGNPAAPVQYFTSVSPIVSAERRYIALSKGLLRTGGVPRELIPLFKSAGVQLVDRPALLVPDVAAVRWRYWAFLVQSMFLAVVAGLFWALARRHHRYLKTYKGLESA